MNHNEESFGVACRCFRERRFDDAKVECENGLSQPTLSVARRVDLLLLRCDILQAEGNPDWQEVFDSADEARQMTIDLPEPARSLRKAQTLNRMGVASRDQAVGMHSKDIDASISLLASARKSHQAALRSVAALDPQFMQIDERELHSIIVSAYNNEASALVEESYIHGACNPGKEMTSDEQQKAMQLLKQALQQFSSCRSACDSLIAEAQVATLNDEAEVLLRLSRVCGPQAELGLIAFHRGHLVVGQALELLDEITDRRVRISWEGILRAKIAWSVSHDLNYSDKFALSLVGESFSANKARLAGIEYFEGAWYQLGTVDVYYTPWSPSSNGGRSSEGPARLRFDRALANVRRAFSARDRMNKVLLRNGWHSLHIQDIRDVLNSAVELGEAAAVCEIIETCRAQGYSSLRPQPARLVGDPVDSGLNRALAGIGVATVIGSPPDLAVRDLSQLQQLAEQTIDVDSVRRSALTDQGWWWSLMQCGEGTLYWSVLTHNDVYAGKLDTHAGDIQADIVPPVIMNELAHRRRRDDPPLRLVVSPCGGLGQVCWAMLPVWHEAGSRLAAHADIRVAPSVPLLYTCLQRRKSSGPWPISLLVVADPKGDLSSQTALPDAVSGLVDANGIILKSARHDPEGSMTANREDLKKVLKQLGDRPFGGTMVYTGHGVSDGPDPLDGFGLALDNHQKWTARDMIGKDADPDRPTLPARVILAACQTMGVGRNTSEWTSVAPAALFAGSEVVFATCQDLLCDQTNLQATVDLCKLAYESDAPAAALSALQRLHLPGAEVTAEPHPLLCYSAVIGRGGL